jgi:hypothetical protein
MKENVDIPRSKPIAKVMNFAGNRPKILPFPAKTSSFPSSSGFRQVGKQGKPLSAPAIPAKKRLFNQFLKKHSKKKPVIQTISDITEFAPVPSSESKKTFQDHALSNHRLPATFER